MSDKSLVYRLKADITAYASGMRAARGIMVDFADQATRADRQSAQFRRGLKDLGNVGAKVGLVAAAGIGAAVVAASNFEQSMSDVRAATHETAANMDLLRAAALRAGAETVYSATEAAAAIEELSKAGVSTRDILAGGLDGALSLAAAGSLDVAEAAEVAASTMTQFKLAGTDVSHIADLLAAGAGRAQGSVHDLGMALSQVGLVSSQVGLSVEETSGALAAMASAGLIGSDAGTSMKQFLLAMTGNSEAASKQMEALGISAYDAQGKFVGLAKYAGILHESLGKLTDEQRTQTLKTIFGTDAIRAANVLYDQGAAGVRKWIAAVDDQGFAAQTASIRLNNLKGDLEGLKGSLETALIGTGSGSQGALRSTTQGLTDMVNAYNGLPDAAKDAAFATGAFIATAGGGLFLFSRTVTGIAAMRAAMVDLGITAEGTTARMVAFRGASLGLGAGVAGLSLMADESTKTGTAIESLGLTAGGALIGFSVGGPIGAAIGAGAGGLTALAKATVFASDEAEHHKKALRDYASTLDQTTGAVTRKTKAEALAALQEAGLVDQARRAGIATSDLIGAALGQEKATNRVRDAMGKTLSVTDALTQSKLLDWLGETTYDITVQGNKIRENNAVLTNHDHLLAKLPDKKVTRLGLTGYEAAMLKLGSLRAAMRDLDTSVDIRIRRAVTTTYAGSPGLQKYATGGYVSGPGTQTSDSIPAWLSNGEYVMNAKSTAKYRHMLEAMNANRYAAGGYVGSGSMNVQGTFTLSDRDAARIVQMLQQVRPMYGDVTINQASDKVIYDALARRNSRQSRGGF